MSATTTKPSPDHCTCEPGQPCGCGYAALLSAIFFPEDDPEA
jgi:hypothetical protein